MLNRVPENSHSLPPNLRVGHGTGEEFTNRCLVSILNRSSNELRNDFAAARPTSKQQNRCLESWYAPIVS
jgi:hypothetical protein